MRRKGRVQNNQYKWQEREENQARPRPLHQRLCPSHQGLDFSSPSEELEDSSDMLTTLRESVLVPPSTWPQCSSTSLLRSSNSPETPPRTTRRPESSPGTSCSPSGTTRSSTSFCTTPPLPKEECSPTSADPSPEPSRAAASLLRLYDSFLLCFYASLSQRTSYYLEMEDKYQCHICMETAHKPIVTPCGHLFCWQCIYHWLRSNQEYLTCPLCKSGLELSSVRPILVKDEQPEKEEGGVPPRPRPFAKVKQNGQWKDIPKTILAMGMNIQRGVMLAGYGIFPSAYLCIRQNHKEPQNHQDLISSNNIEYKLHNCARYLSYVLMLLVVVMVWLA